MKNRTVSKGFTLIELIIVVIIVGVLSSIAAPIMNNMQKRAILTEAVTVLGTIRTNIGAYLVEYPQVAVGDIPWSQIGVDSTLTGIYIGWSSYIPDNVINNPSHPHSTWCIECWLYPQYNAEAPNGSVTTKLFGSFGELIMLDDGSIWQTGITDSGFPSY